MKRIYDERPYEFWVALTAAAVVIFAGVEQSILLAIVLSLGVHTRHGYRPNNMLIVADSIHGWRLRKVSTREQVVPGLMIYRFMHNMYYANVQTLTEEVVDLIKGAEPPLHWLCIDLAAVNDVDFTASETLRALHGNLQTRGVRLVFSELIDEVQAEFDRSQLTSLVGQDAIFPTLTDAMTTYQQKGS